MLKGNCNSGICLNQLILLRDHFFEEKYLWDKFHPNVISHDKSASSTNQEDLFDFIYKERKT